MAASRRPSRSTAKPARCWPNGPTDPWLSAFALFAAIVIGVTVYLIARQFKIHADLAAMRADRIEAEKSRANGRRLAAETELLKSERLSVLGQLTATVAHELRNPLSAIRNTLFTVKELAANGGIKLDRPIARMERSIERCDRIISDLLEYTRNRELNRTDLRFDRWLADMLAEQTIPAPIVLATELRAPGAVVPADADRFRRVVINLVENAAQALAETPGRSREAGHGPHRHSRRRAGADGRGYRPRHPAGEPQPHLRAAVQHQELRDRPGPADG